MRRSHRDVSGIYRKEALGAMKSTYQQIQDLHARADKIERALEQREAAGRPQKRWDGMRGFVLAADYIFSIWVASTAASFLVIGGAKARSVMQELLLGVQPEDHLGEGVVWMASGASFVATIAAVVIWPMIYMESSGETRGIFFRWKEVRK